MAYMSQENKKAIAPQIKAVLKKYNMKGSISVRHQSALVVTLKEGELDILKDSDREYSDVNVYWIDDHYTGKVRDFLKELKDAMNGEGSEGKQNFDKSDIQSDYHFVGWYITISVGKWDKPFICT